MNKLVENGSENIVTVNLNIKTSQSPLVSESLAENLSKIQLMDDNSSFFSHNSFQKILPDADSSYSDSSSVTPQSNILNDTLPDISSSEDWQAAFGFNSKENTVSLSNHHQSNSEIVASRCSNHNHNMLNMPNGSLDIIKNLDFSEAENSGDPLDLGVLNRYNSKHILESAQQSNDIRQQQQNLVNFSNKMSSENTLNGLDLQMSKFFAEFKTHGYAQHQQTQQQNGFLTPHIREPSNNFLAMNSYEHLMLLNQQQRFDKLDPETIYNLKQQHMFQQTQNHHNPQQMQPQQFLAADYGPNYQGNNSNYTPQVNAVYHRGGAPLQHLRQERPNVEDDLGFDPFHETQKALAELIESEQGVSQLRNAGKKPCYWF